MSTILPIVALLSAALIAYRRTEHRWIVLVLAVVLLYAAAGEHLPGRADLALRALIPLATSLAYVAVWKAPPWAPWAIGIAWVWPVGFICWAPMPAAWWAAASIVPCAASVVVGAITVIAWGRRRRSNSERVTKFLRREFDDDSGPISVHSLRLPEPSTITERIAALWLLGDTIGLVIAWKAPEMLALEGQAELALVAVFQIGWIIHRLLKRGHT